MKLEFNFTCCCSVRFAKIYGKLMRDIRKQYGKKKVSEFTIIASETPKEIIVHNINRSHYIRRIPIKTEYYCTACGKQHVYANRFIGSVYNITIEG